MEALMNYVKIGKDIRQDATKEFREINDLIRLGKNDPWICKYSDVFTPKNVNLVPSVIVKDRFFIALAAPSFSGKTQMSFAINSKMPLYFVLSAGSSQSVYKNFESVSNSLKRYARLDVARIPDTDVIESDSEKKFEYLSTGNLNESTAFTSLGFLWALLEDAERFFSTPRSARDLDNWMVYFADRSSAERKTFNFRAMSLEECRRDATKLDNFINRFFIFLDEFEGKDFAVFLRNILRSLGFTGCLASTNSKVANLTGSTSSSRDGSVLLWSVVVTKLPPMKKNYVYIAYKLQTIWNFLSDAALKISFAESGKINAFFSYIRDHQLENLRPGIACLVASLIVQFCNNNSQNLPRNLCRALFAFILNGICQYISLHKKRITSSKYGPVAQVALLSSEMFHADYEYHRDTGIYKPDFLNDHLFNIINPRPKNRPSMFLTYTGIEMSTSLNVVDEISGSFLDFAFKTFFDEKEEILKLALYMLDINKTTAKAVDLSLLPSTSIIGNIANPREIYRCGNNLETASMFSFIDSSHTKHRLIQSQLESEKIFDGVDGLTFLERVVTNFSEYSNMFKVNVTPKLKSFLKSVTVPFLNTSNMKPSGVCNSILGLSEFKRTRNVDQIDAIFDISCNNVPCYAVVECKNLADSVKTHEYYDIIFKARKYEKNVKLHFLVCTSIEQTNPNYLTEYLTAIQTYTAQNHNNCNIYRFTYADSSREMTAVPYRADFKYYTDPDMVFLIIEKNYIF